MQTKVIMETEGSRYELISRAIEGLGSEFDDRVKAAEKIFLKVNLLHFEVQLAVTHIDAVRAVLDRIRYISRTPVVIGDGAHYGTLTAFRHFGYENLLKEYDHIELIDLNDDDYVDAYSRRGDGEQQVIRRAKSFMEADLVISLTPMKTHSEIGASLGLENATIGTWIVPSRISAEGRIWSRLPWLDDETNYAYHATIIELAKQKKPDISIVDGYEIMEGEGPLRGNYLPYGVALAGTDSVAVDTVAATLMGMDPMDIGYLAMAHESGLGTVDMAKIDAPPMLLSEYTRQVQLPLEVSYRLTDWRKKA